MEKTRLTRRTIEMLRQQLIGILLCIICLADARTRTREFTRSTDTLKLLHVVSITYIFLYFSVILIIVSPSGL